VLTTTQLVLVLALATGLVALSARRLAALGLAIQFILSALLLGPVMLQPVLIARLSLGLAACLILFLSATALARAQRSRMRAGAPPLARMGSLFGLLCVALAGFVATGIYRAFPLPGLPEEITLASYWLVMAGLLLATMEGSVLSQGLAAMTALNGFGVVFLRLESGLLMIGLLSLLEIGLALTVAVLSDQQTESLSRPELD